LEEELKSKQSTLDQVQKLREQIDKQVVDWEYEDEMEVLRANYQRTGNSSDREAIGKKIQERINALGVEIAKAEAAMAATVATGGEVKPEDAQKLMSNLQEMRRYSKEYDKWLNEDEKQNKGATSQQGLSALSGQSLFQQVNKVWYGSDMKSVAKNTYQISQNTKLTNQLLKGMNVMAGMYQNQVEVDITDLEADIKEKNNKFQQDYEVK